MGIKCGKTKNFTYKAKNYCLNQTKMFDCQETVPQLPTKSLKFEKIRSWPSGSVSDSFRNLAQVRFPLESVSDIQRLYI